MTGREDENANNLFFLCSLIEYIGRKTKNHRNVVVNAIEKDDLQHVFDWQIFITAKIWTNWRLNLRKSII